jgi:hypothetical protein
VEVRLPDDGDHRGVVRSGSDDHSFSIRDWSTVAEASCSGQW